MATRNRSDGQAHESSTRKRDAKSASPPRGIPPSKAIQNQTATTRSKATTTTTTTPMRHRLSQERVGIRYVEQDQDRKVLRSKSITQFDYESQTRPETVLSWKASPKRCLIVKKIYDKQCSKDLKKVSKFLKTLNIETYVEPIVKEKEFPHLKAIDYNDPGKGIDLAITIGGM